MDNLLLNKKNIRAHDIHGGLALIVVFSSKVNYGYRLVILVRHREIQTKGSLLGFFVQKEKKIERK